MSRNAATLSVDDIQDQLNQLPPRVIAAFEPLQKLQSIVRDRKDPTPRLPAVTLEVSEAKELFGLVTAKDITWSLSEHEVYDPPKLLETTFATDEQATENEAYPRCLINNVLVCCVAEEKRVAKRAAAQQSNEPSSSRPGTPPDRAYLTLRLETPLQYKVRYKGQMRLVNGYADYTLWYGSASMATNLVVVAERHEFVSYAERQLITYMGIVHRTRLDEKRHNLVVYGVTSDGNQYHFYRIDNKSRISSSRPYEWARGDQREITSYLRYIIRAAIASSPSTSPIKPGENRGINFTDFNDQDREARFDFGAGTREESKGQNESGQSMDTSGAV